MSALLLALAFLQAGSLGMTSIDRGEISGIENAAQLVARTPADWQALWARHESGKPLPPVDFSSEMVVAVALGSRPSSGYGIEIVAAERDGDDLVVRYRATTPARGTVAAAIVTTPYHFVRVPRVEGTVRFEKVP